MNIKDRITRRIKKQFTPKPKVLRDRYVNDLPLKRYGSKYGGWVLSENVLKAKTTNITILSAGLGEDASFDIEMARSHECDIHIIDPTPRAIAHYESICARMGKRRQRTYSNDGNQAPTSYPLDDLKGSLALVPVALWEQTTELEFYLPTNPDHISCSISDIQHNNTKMGNSIKVQGMTLSEICRIHEIDPQGIDILKLDIEGAEIEVLNNVLDGDIRPTQILVEYDELMFPSIRNYRRVQNIHDKLLSNGYSCYHSDGVSCFSYISVNS